jgi:hypothetical protein
VIEWVILVLVSSWTFSSGRAERRQRETQREETGNGETEEKDREDRGEEKMARLECEERRLADAWEAVKRPECRAEREPGRRRDCERDGERRHQ